MTMYHLHLHCIYEGESIFIDPADLLWIMASPHSRCFPPHTLGFQLIHFSYSSLDGHMIWAYQLHCTVFMWEVNLHSTLVTPHVTYCDMPGKGGLLDTYQLLFSLG